MTLPTDSKMRKQTPIFSGLLMYFPDACIAVAQLSYLANEKHNPGESMHWTRDISTDHPDCCVRHLMESGGVDEFGLPHEVAAAWRALAHLQLKLEELEKANE